MLVIGSRVQDHDGFKATIRYKGSVAASKNKEETWLGVEWDDASRGKHDGSCVENGVIHRYFECRMGSGSFIKPSKIQTGKSFYQALQDRYVSVDAPEVVASDSTLPGLFVSTSKGHQKPIEFVGEMKIRKYQQVSTINKVMLRNESISTCGLSSDNIVGHLIEVDIQDNLLSDWAEVFRILDQTPLLESLLLHGNKLQEMTPEIAATLKPHPHLKRLAMNATGARGWAGVALLDQLFPQLEELYLAENDMRDLPFILDEEDALALSDDVISRNHSHIKGFKNLRILDLTACGIDDWARVQSLGQLPCLQQLILDDNPISRIFPPVKAANVSSFGKLKRLSLSSTKISSWTDINMLSMYTALEHLRLSHVPILAGMSASEARTMVLGRLARLGIFNASVIKPRERCDAEKAYLRSILRDINKSVPATSSSTSVDAELIPGTPEYDALLQLHPRYPELAAQYTHELLPMGRGESSGPRSLASELIAIKISNVSSSNLNPHAQSLEKKLPLTLTVGKLRRMLKQLYGLDPECQQLALRVDKDSIPVVLDDDDSSLSYYGAVDGSEIFVNEI